ncbi:papain family cysteine protease domain-containing protein [Ditylenchus destructor]|nr:papain family cysteine protease domain-containing protein [Ditylenchus destructor]
MNFFVVSLFLIFITASLYIRHARSMEHHDVLESENVRTDLFLKLGANLSSNEADMFATFQKFVRVYGKIYHSEEEVIHRYQIYKQNLAEAEILQKNDEGTAEFGETKFSDLTREEFEKIYLKFIPSTNPSKDMPQPKYERYFDTPSQYDWREKGKVGKIKDQDVPAPSGCCYAFCLIAIVESMFAIKHNTSVPVLSEQQVVDCTSGDCEQGADPWESAGQLINSSGIVAEDVYPYTGHKGKCSSKHKPIIAKITTRNLVPSDEDQMAKALVAHGPLSIAVCGHPLHQYKRGVYKPKNQEECLISHGMDIVGFGTTTIRGIDNEPYWIIRNSWGVDFGEDGYMRLYRGKNYLKVTEEPFYVEVE